MKKIYEELDLSPSQVRQICAAMIDGGEAKLIEFVGKEIGTSSPEGKAKAVNAMMNSLGYGPQLTVFSNEDQAPPAWAPGKEPDEPQNA